MGTNYSPRSVTNGLILYLDAGNTRSYPGSGTTWSDLSGVGNNATLINGPTYTAEGKGGIIFDGTNDYCNIPYDALKISFPTNNATILVWFKISLTGDATGALLTQRSSGDSGFQTYVINNKLYADGGGAGSTYGATTLGRNKVYFGGFVYDKLNSLIKLYLNGVLDGQNTYPGDIQDTYPIVISSSAFGDGPFPVTIYSAQVYNRVLSVAEIKQNFNALRGRYGI